MPQLVAAAEEISDLAVIIVSYGSAAYLPACLETLHAHVGGLDVDVVVADNDPGDEVATVMARYPFARRHPIANRGFAAGNNDAVRVSKARHYLFLNPDTEIRSGTLADLVQLLDARPGIGLVGVRQVLPSGELFPTMRRFPSVARAIADALAIERFGRRRLSLGERILDLSRYDTEFAADWTSGSFMLARGEALLAAGLFDERFFMFNEEVDLCLRIKRAGFSVIHSPRMEILHHANKSGVDPRLEAQQALARRQYARKHFGRLRSAAFIAAVALKYVLRAGASRAWWRSARHGLPLLLGRGQPPFASPPPVSVISRPPAGVRAV